MSAAEQIEASRGTSPRRDVLLEEEAFIETQLTQSPARTGARLRPLLELAPYVARYRGRALLALVSLTVAAITTLVVPVAVRRMIDFGFSPEGIALINSYFSVMIAVVAVLAGASASRFYLVMVCCEIDIRPVRSPPRIAAIGASSVGRRAIASPGSAMRKLLTQATSG